MKQKIYKLKYTDKETAIANLIAKGVYTEDLNFGENVEAIVEIGKIVDIQGTYDEEGNEIAPTTFLDGYHYDIMYNGNITFENEIEVNNPKHSFSGW